MHYVCNNNEWGYFYRIRMCTLYLTLICVLNNPVPTHVADFISVLSPLPSSLPPLPPPPPPPPQLEVKCFNQQEQLDSLQDQLDSERDEAGRRVAELEKELGVQLDKVKKLETNVTN